MRDFWQCNHLPVTYDGCLHTDGYSTCGNSVFASSHTMSRVMASTYLWETDMKC